MAKQARVGLGFWDRLVLLLAWGVTCGIVYVLGFYVGKGTQEQPFGFSERIVRLPVTTGPPPEGQRPKTGQELTFYDTLLAGKRTDTGREKTAKAATAPPSPPTTVARAAAPTLPPAPSVKVEPVPGEIAPPAAEPMAAPDATAAPSRTGAWTVQVNPTRDRAEAQALFERLRARGYQATLVHVLRDGETWYRVSVGRFANSVQATEVMHQLRQRDGVSHVFLASE